jgi:TetR/AcrR family transcriptional regulator, transcriptional repressor for nem operon
MRDGPRTRRLILERAAELFNTRGVAGTSMSDLMEATGLQKGGLYRHFAGKEALAAEAFDHAVARVAGRFAAALEGRSHAVDRLRAVIRVFAAYGADPPVPGGCPILNTAVECDDALPALRERSRRAMEGMRRLVLRNVRDGMARGEIRAEIDAEELATVLVSTMEGAVVLARVLGDPEHLERAARWLERHLEASVRAEAR